MFARLRKLIKTVNAKHYSQDFQKQYVSDFFNIFTLLLPVQDIKVFFIGVKQMTLNFYQDTDSY